MYFTSDMPGGFGGADIGNIFGDDLHFFLLDMHAGLANINHLKNISVENT